MWSGKWRESWKREREEEVVLAAVQEEVLSESKEKSESAQRRPRRRMGRRSRRWRGGGALSLVKSAASAPGSVALLDRALACPVCGESVGGTPALCCAQCTCGPFRAQCAQPVAVCFTGAAEGAQEVRA